MVYEIVGAEPKEKAERKVKNLRDAVKKGKGEEVNEDKGKVIKSSVGGLEKSFVRLVNILYSYSAKGTLVTLKIIKQRLGIKLRLKQTFTNLLKKKGYTSKIVWVKKELNRNLSKLWLFKVFC